MPPPAPGGSWPRPMEVELPALAAVKEPQAAARKIIQLVKDRKAYDAAKRISLMLLKSLTSPPTRRYVYKRTIGLFV